MTVKLFGVNTLKTYYEAPHKADVLRWAVKSFKGASVYAVEGEHMLPEPMMIYDDCKNYHEADLNGYSVAFTQPIKVIMAKKDDLGNLTQHKFSNRRKAAAFLHVSVGTLLACEGQEIKGWEILEVD